MRCRDLIDSIHTVSFATAIDDPASCGDLYHPLVKESLLLQTPVSL